MRRTAVVLAVVVVLSGCGTETSGTSAQEATATSSTSETPAPSEEPDDQPSEEPSEEPSKRPSRKAPATPLPADAPECAAVWVDGTTLARGYEGCRAGQRFIAPDEEPCSFGQRLVRFSDRFYAVRGGPVNRTAAPLDKDRVYRGALASCRA